MLVYELCNKCGNWIDKYRFIFPNGDYKEYTDFTSFEDKLALNDCRRFTIEKTAHEVIMEVIL